MPPRTVGPGALAVRLVEVPDVAPPYDRPSYDGQADGTRRPAWRVVPEPARPPVARWPPADPGPEARQAASAASGTAWPGQLAQVIVEILAGARPDRQLIPLTTDRVRAQIQGLAPLLRSDRRPRVQRVVASRPAARAVEVTVVAAFGPRSRALAMRFEHVAARPAAPGWPARPARWICTAFEAG